MKQFDNIRNGDKFWYENQLNQEQIAELEKINLEKIICNYGDGIEQVPRDVFSLFLGGV